MDSTHREGALRQAICSFAMCRDWRLWYSSIQEQVLPFLFEGEVEEWKKKPWGHLERVFVQNVNCFLWIDQGPVRIISTVHLCDPEEVVSSLRKKPRTSSSNAASVRRVFGGEDEKVIDIPKIIDDYNHNKLTCMIKCAPTTPQTCVRVETGFLFFVFCLRLV